MFQISRPSAAPPSRPFHRFGMERLAPQLLLIAAIVGSASTNSSALSPAALTAPTITDIANQTIAPNTATAPLAFTIGDDLGTAGLVLSGSSSDQTLVPNGNIVFGGSGASRTVTVTPAANRTGSTTITVTVTDGDGASASDAFTVTVVPSLTILSASVTELDVEGPIIMTFDVLLSAVSSQQVTVQYQTVQLTAIAGVDFTAASNTLTFAPGTTQQSVNIAVSCDTRAEIDETLAVSLTTPVNATIANGFATGTIIDNDGTPDSRAALVAWTMPDNVTELVGTGWLIKDGTTGWNSGAASAQALLDGDGWVEFTAEQTNTTRMAGLSRGNTNADYSDIDFGLYLHSNGTFYVVEGGVTRGVFGTYTGSDRFSVAVESGVVVYRRNGALFYTSSVAPTYPLLVDTALYTPLARLIDVAMGGHLAREIVWVNSTGTSVYPLRLQKWDATGWNAGAASTRALISGNGFLEFTAAETTTTRMAGLSRDNSSTDWNDIDFAIYLHAGGQVYIVEGEASVGVFGNYVTGDRFQVAVESGQVVYRRNGVTLYTSELAPVYPLQVDTAFFTFGASLTDFLLSGTFAMEASYAAVFNTDACACYYSLVKQSGAPVGWNAGAISTQALARGDGFVEFMTNNDPTHKMAGLSHGNTNTDPSDIDFAVLLASNLTFYVFEGGISRGVFGVYESGDRFRVSVESGVVQYRKNGVPFYTSLVAPSYPLLVDAALYTADAKILDVVIAGDWGQPVTFTAAVNVQLDSGMVTKTGALGWNAGAVSTYAIASGDGFVSFSTGDTTTHKLIGLSQGNTNTDFSDIDFAILLASNGTFYVFESGTFRGVFGAYVAGDLFQVAVEGGVVKYLRNGGVFYTSGGAPEYPLLVDTALYTPGATLIDVVLGCVSAACQ